MDGEWSRGKKRRKIKHPHKLNKTMKRKKKGRRREIKVQERGRMKKERMKERKIED